MFTNNDSAYEAAAMELRNAGVAIKARSWTRDLDGGAMAETARAVGIEVLTGHIVEAAHGDPTLTAVTVRPIEGAVTRAGTGSAAIGAEDRPARRIACDLLAVSGG